ncbi:MAG: hypothetical protein PHP86_14950 [Nevskiales bacterium]|nr:hypothetical protein [Nevskiales bacterium]
MRDDQMLGAGRVRAGRDPGVGRLLGCGLGLAAAGLFSAPALATNGYFSHGYSASQSAMGGAGTALVEDALVAAINPGASVWIGNRMDVNLALFAPIRDYTASERGPDAQQSIFSISPGTIRSDNDLYYIPGFAVNWAIDETQSWGIAVYGNGGMNTEYHGNTAHFAQGLAMQDPTGLLLDINFETECQGTFGGGPPVEGAEDQAGLCGNDDPTAGVDLIQLFITPYYSRKIGERTSIGISPIIAAQRFRADGLKAFARFSNSPDNVSDNGFDYSYGYGGRIGFLTGAIPGFGFGASYQTKIKMTEFDKYKGLFAEQGGFDIPSSWNVGISAHLSENQRLALDWQRINFSEVRSVGNSLDPNRFVNGCALPVLLGDFLADNPLFDVLINAPEKDPSACLGAATGPGFGWEDMDVYKVGYQLKFASFKFRVGYSMTKQPIPSREVLFNVLAPAVIDNHYTAGLSYQMSTALGFEFALMYAEDNPVKGKNPLSNTDATVIDLIGFGASTDQAFGEDPQDQDLSLDMHQWQAVFGVSYRFK